MLQLLLGKHEEEGPEKGDVTSPMTVGAADTCKSCKGKLPERAVFCPYCAYRTSGETMPITPAPTAHMLSPGLDKATLAWQRQMIDAIWMPAAEGPKFTGDELKYPVFMSHYMAAYRDSSLSYKEKLGHLLERCSDDIKNILEPANLMDEYDGYTYALETLQERYGDEATITKKYIDKITAGPVLEEDDAKGLRKYADMITACYGVLKHLEKLGDLVVPSL